MLPWILAFCCVVFCSFGSAFFRILTNRMWCDWAIWVLCHRISICLSNSDSFAATPKMPNLNFNMIVFCRFIVFFELRRLISRLFCNKPTTILNVSDNFQMCLFAFEPTLHYSDEQTIFYLVVIHLSKCVGKLHCSRTFQAIFFSYSIFAFQFFSRWPISFAYAECVFCLFFLSFFMLACFPWCMTCYSCVPCFFPFVFASRCCYLSCTIRILYFPQNHLLSIAPDNLETINIRTQHTRSIATNTSKMQIFRYL